LFAIKSAQLFGAERIIAIDRLPERLELAEEAGAAVSINFDSAEVYPVLQELTGGRGPDRCIDAVGLEAHETGSFDAVVDALKTRLMLATDRAHVLRQAVFCCRKAGTVSIPGVYGGFVDKFTMGAAFQKGLTLKMGQTHVHRYMQPLLERIERGELDPRFVISHRMQLHEAADAYRIFHEKSDRCTKVVLQP
jgi:threonine dehydrogenase-like Zn-dependent dehydrogenase